MNQFHDGICSVIDVLEENLQGDGAGYLRHAWNIAAGEGLHAGALRRRIYRVRAEAFECGYSRGDDRMERTRKIYRDPLDVAEESAEYAE
jgi:hypothetical protein